MKKTLGGRAPRTPGRTCWDCPPNITDALTPLQVTNEKELKWTKRSLLMEKVREQRRLTQRCIDAGLRRLIFYLLERREQNKT